MLAFGLVLENSQEELEFVELRLRRDTVNLVDQRRNLDLDKLPVLLGVDAVGGLNREHPNPLEDRRCLVQVAFRGLHEGHAVLGVALGLAKSHDLGPHLFGNRKARCVVAGSVDAHAGRELFHRTVHVPVLELKHPVRVDGAHVVIDNHTSHSFVWCRPDLPIGL